jgi:hypothetical protein
MGCEDVIEGQDVKFFPLPDGVQVEALVMYFHGDGGDGYFNDWGFDKEILAWAQARNYLVLGVLSPASYEDATIAYGAAQPSHAVEVADTIEVFVDAYAPNEDSLYWGVSGGSWHFASSFVAAVGNRLPGIFVANCGGSGGSWGWSWDPQVDTDMRDRIAIYFNYGTEDFLADNANNSYNEFLGMGFVTDQLVVQGATHCDHPIAGPTIDFWERHVD